MAVHKDEDLFPQRWNQLEPIAEQIALEKSRARFRVCPAGRRSGKTEFAKRFLIMGDPENGFPGALTYDRPFDDGWYIAAAPTHAQAKRIFWKDLNGLLPKWAVKRRNLSENTFVLINGVELTVMGMDKPERAEGRPIDGIVMDEYGNMKKEAWANHVRPGLSTRGRPGWAWLIGVPEGRNHYFDLYMYATTSGDPFWSGHTWPSELVISPEEIAAAKRELDPLTYDQEYRGSFVNFAGRAYYAFGEHNIFNGTKYDQYADLNVCFDFNVAPGVAIICQEQSRSWYPHLRNADAPILLDAYGNRQLDNSTVTVVLGEVYIPMHSNTPAVCRKFVADWGKKAHGGGHKGRVIAYGDATGGAKGTSSVDGSDWDLIDAALRRAFPDGQYINAVGHSNPRERVRVNAMNARCKTEDGTVSLILDGRYAKFLQKDFEGVTTLEGTNGELDKVSDKALTHMTDAIGYYVQDQFPIGGDGVEVL